MNKALATLITSSAMLLALSGSVHSSPEKIVPSHFLPEPQVSQERDAGRCANSTLAQVAIGVGSRDKARETEVPLAGWGCFPGFGICSYTCYSCSFNSECPPVNGRTQYCVCNAECP